MAINKRCIKCGSENASLNYVGNITYYKWLGGGYAKDSPKEEYMQITCRVCGYMWRVEPLEKRGTK